MKIDLNRHASSPIHDTRVEVYVPNSSSQPPNEADMNVGAMVIHEEEVHVGAETGHVYAEASHVDIYEETLS